MVIVAGATYRPRCGDKCGMAGADGRKLLSNVSIIILVVVYVRCILRWPIRLSGNVAAQAENKTLDENVCCGQVKRKKSD